MNEPTERENQIIFLKSHEEELTNFIKSKNPKSNISYIQYDWDSFEIGDSGAFTQKLYSVPIDLYDKKKKEINGGIINIIPDSISKPTKIKKMSTNDFDTDVGGPSDD